MVTFLKAIVLLTILLIWGTLGLFVALMLLPIFPLSVVWVVLWLYLTVIYLVKAINWIRTKDGELR